MLGAIKENGMRKKMEGAGRESEREGRRKVRRRIRRDGKDITRAKSGGNEVVKKEEQGC